MATIDFKKIADAALNDYELNTQLTRINSAKRSVIQINNLYGYKNDYIKDNNFKSRELITAPVKAIAIFCNEYIPDHFPSDNYFTYNLVINGKTYNIEPINSQRPGKKIIRNSESNTLLDTIEYINEPIKSAYLNISLKAFNTETPFISNLKILVGGA